MRLHPVELSNEQNAHDGRSFLVGVRKAGINPATCVPGRRGGSDFDAIAVGCQVAVVDEASWRRLAYEAVVDGFGRRASVGHLLPFDRCDSSPVL